jgi:hypothetical protein
MAGRPDEPEHFGPGWYHDANSPDAGDGEIGWRQVPISPLHRKSPADVSIDFAVSQQQVFVERREAPLDDVFLR